MPGASTRGGREGSDSHGLPEHSRRKTHADLLFLAGLVLGGPTMTLGGHFRFGLFLVLAGGIASLLRRYAGASLGGSVALGTAVAALIAAVLVNPPGSAGSTEASEDMRAAFVEELVGVYEPDGLVEARGPGLETVWFFLPEVQEEAPCGTIPGESVREHLRDLGFRRVVVADRASQGSLCNFEP